MIACLIAFDLPAGQRSFRDSATLLAAFDAGLAGVCAASAPTTKGRRMDEAFLNPEAACAACPGMRATSPSRNFWRSERSPKPLCGKRAPNCRRFSKEWRQESSSSIRNRTGSSTPIPVALELTGAPREKMVGAVCPQFVCPAEQGRCPVTDLGQDGGQLGARAAHGAGGEALDYQDGKAGRNRRTPLSSGKFSPIFRSASARKRRSKSRPPI